MTHVSTGAKGFNPEHLNRGQINNAVRAIILKSARDGRCTLATASLQVKLGEMFNHEWARQLTPFKLQYMLKYNRDLLGIQALGSRTYRKTAKREFHGKFATGEAGAEVGGHGHKRSELSRFGADKSKIGRLYRLYPEHPALAEARPMFPTRVFPPLARDRVLIPGHSNPKIGGFVVRGRKWGGAAVRTLTLPERTTCSRACHHWDSCVGNNMPAPVRLMPGRQLEYRLRREIGEFDAAQTWESANLLLVRLHVLGDFYSPEYVELWRGLLGRFQSLRVFGYSAWLPNTEIGKALARLMNDMWDRFSIRFSRRLPVDDGYPQAITVPDAETAHKLGAIVCPAQTGKTMTCGTCGLCWTAREKVIAFIWHGRRGGHEGPGLIDMESRPGEEGVEWTALGELSET